MPGYPNYRNENKGKKLSPNNANFKALKPLTFASSITKLTLLFNHYKSALNSVE